MTTVAIDASMLSGRPSGPVTFAAGVVDGWTDRDRVLGWSAEPGASTPQRLRRHLARRSSAFGGVDAYLSVNPTLPRTVPSSVTTGVVVHDLRHESEPEAFSRAARAYRRLVWDEGIRRADCVFAVSEATAALVADRFGVDAVTIPMGVDHVGEPAASLDGPVLALCHRENKPAATAVAAWQAAERRLGDDLPDLCLVGVDGRALADLDLPRTGRIRAVGRLDAATFRPLLASARAVLFLSRHEGYGLPVAEARALGLPLVATDLPSIRSIVGPDEPLVAFDDDEAAGARLVELLGYPRPEPVRRPAWSDTADVLRRRLLGTDAIRTAAPTPMGAEGGRR